MILPLASATTHRHQIIRKKGTKLRYYVLITRLWTQPKDDNAKKKAASALGDAKKSSKKDDDDDSSVSSSKSMSELQSENARLNRRLKKTNACLVTTINEGDKEDDLTDNEGSMSFVAAAHSWPKCVRILGKEYY